MGDKTVAVIPARENSKSIPLKNIRPIGGKPLIYWVIEAALNSQGIDEVYLTSDSIKIRDCACEFFDNPKFHVIDRLPINATDSASTESVLLEFADNHDFQTLILIQPTSPMLNSSDLEHGIEHYRSGDVDSVLSVVNQKRFIWGMDADDGSFIPLNYDYKNRPRRQDFPGYFVENGAFYITSRSRLLESKCRLSGRIGMVEMSSKSYLELDEQEDWLAIDLYLRKRSQADFHSRLRKVQMLFLDFDGVLTDDRVLVDQYGIEGVFCSRSDGLGLAMLREHTNIEVFVLSSETNPVVARRCEKLKIPFYQGCDHKLSLLQNICSERGVISEKIAYMGNDVNDLDCLRWSGCSVAPAGSHPDVLACVDYVTEKHGGLGALRELAELLIQEHGMNR